MEKKNTPAAMHRSPAQQRGQTAILALFVMLLLAFIGAVFVTIVARNLVNAHHQNVVVTADTYAASGIQYADQQLTDSDLGADWRPAPTLASSNADPDYAYMNLNTPGGPFSRFNMTNGRFLLRVTYLAGSQVVAGNPQYPLQATNSMWDPYGRYIKIESIGRQGVVMPNDPTTFNAGRQNSTLVAYKAIGITDYARFETNIDKRSDVMDIGVPSVNTGGTNIDTPGVWDFNAGTLAQYPVVTTLGAPDAYLYDTATGYEAPNPNAGDGETTSPGTPGPEQWVDGSVAVAPGGGTFRSNASVRFFGQNNVYLNSVDFQNYLNYYNNPTPTLEVPNGMILDEHMEVFGNVLLDSFDPTKVVYTPTTRVSDVTGSQQAALVINPEPSKSAPYQVQNYVAPSSNPSEDGGFLTLGGAVRDASSSSDRFGLPRSVARLDPPDIDTVDPVTNLTRYRDMAINSPSRYTTGTPWTINPPGEYGFGQVIYVNNTTDAQPESTVPGATTSLVDEWLNRDEGASSNWLGGIYTPPAVEITFGDLRKYGYVPTTSGPGPASNYGVYLLRDSHDVDSNNNPITWVDPVTGLPSGNPGMMVSYDSLNASNLESTGTPASPNPTSNPNNDVIIVAEGNVSISGCVSADAADPTPGTNTNDQLPRHVTIVTYGTAYIDGSLLKGNPASSISVLAHDYVCINTTQFTAGRVIQGQPNVPSPTLPPTTYQGGTDGIDFGSGNGLAEQFSFGVHAAIPYTTQYPGYPPTPPALYIAGQSAGNGLATLDVGLNNPQSPGEFALSSTSTGAYDTISFGTDPTSGTSYPDRTTIPLTSTGVTNSFTTLVESQPLQLWMTYDSSSQYDPVINHIAILPMDARIEASLYAETRSLFVIPGDWFNDSSADNLSAYVNQTALTPGNHLQRLGSIDNDVADQQRFPFFGQPIDMRITIYGAVAESHPADIAAQNAWMQKWGWIPKYHGSMTGMTFGHGDSEISVEDAGHTNGTSPAIGLSIIYDPQCSFPLALEPPVTGPGGSTYVYTRMDAYGNPLPFAPRLPVCPGLLYSGETPQLPAQ